MTFDCEQHTALYRKENATGQTGTVQERGAGGVCVRVRVRAEGKGVRVTSEVVPQAR